MKIEILNNGFFYADGGAMFGAVPKTAWQRRYPCNEDNKCLLAMRSLLIICDDGRIILVDNGVGDKNLRLLKYYNFSELADIKTQLHCHGLKPDDVTDLVLTHLHFDHCGYTTRYDGEPSQLSLSFPNAIHWVSRKQWKLCHNPGPLEKDSYRLENIKTAEEAGKLWLIDVDARINENVSLRLFGGHADGQIAVYIKEEDHTTVFAGDVIPLAANVSPDWISAYDLYPYESYYEKLRMLEEADAEKQTIIYCHDAYTPSSTIKRIGKRTYRPISL